MWVSGGLCRAGLMVALDDPGGLFSINDPVAHGQGCWGHRTSSTAGPEEMPLLLWLFVCTDMAMLSSPGLLFPVNSRLKPRIDPVEETLELGRCDPIPGLPEQPMEAGLCSSAPQSV